MEDREIWRPIPSLPSHIASSHGRIMRVPHLSGLPNGGFLVYGGTLHHGVWEPKFKRYIYQYGGKTYKVHRLVCEAFNGAPPRINSVCMHIDENSKNNAPSNLAWGTQKENLNAPGFLAYCRGRTGEDNPYCKGKRGGK